MTIRSSRYFFAVFIWLATLMLSSSVLAKPPTRIVSLDLCSDWMLLRYVDPSRILAFSPMLYRNPENWIPANLNRHDGSLEQLLTLQPDLVLTGEFNALELREKLRQLGQPVEILPMPDSLPGLQTYLERFQQAIQTPLPTLKTVTYPSKQHTLLLLGANAIGTGRGTLENDVIERAGWRNYLKQSGYISLDLEQVVNKPPDVLLWSVPANNSLANLFAQHVALKKVNGLQVVYGTEDWRWQCPGPWTLDLITEMARWPD